MGSGRIYFFVMVLVFAVVGLPSQAESAPTPKDSTTSSKFCQRHPHRCVTTPPEDAAPTQPTEPVLTEPSEGATPPQGEVRDVFADAVWYVDPYSNARRMADGLRSAEPLKAALFDKIGDHAQADWFGDWNSTATVASTVSDRVRTIKAAGALPVFVAYAIPIRDCNGYSGGGMSSAAAYRAWIGELADGLGTSRAAIILEPDALALMECLTPTQRTERLNLLADAVATLSNNPNAAVYIDAGHSDWHPASVMAERLELAGVQNARGFALNVSNFNTTARELSYGRDLATQLRGKHFVIDTSRNGLGPSNEPEAWCNPSGRALGDRPTAGTTDPLADAYLWIKRPGESDGTCKGGPNAGLWWSDFALGLAERASW
jgi:endoglucanase